VLKPGLERDAAARAKGEAKRSPHGTLEEADGELGLSQQGMGVCWSHQPRGAENALYLTEALDRGDAQLRTEGGVVLNPVDFKTCAIGTKAKLQPDAVPGFYGLDIGEGGVYRSFCGHRSSIGLSQPKLWNTG
jgi:hypothetical protein